MRGPVRRKVKPILGKVSHHFKSKIKYQLVFSYLGIVLSLIAILGGVIFYSVPRILEAKSSQHMEELSNQIILNMENNLSRLEQLSTLLNFEREIRTLGSYSRNSDVVGVNEFLNSYGKIDDYFINLIYAFDLIHGAYIYTAEGRNVYARNLNQAFHTSETVDREAWFADAIEARGESVIRSRHTNAYMRDSTEVISLSRANIDYATNRIIGVSVVEQDVQQIGELITNYDSLGKSAVFLVDADGVPIFVNNTALYETSVYNGDHVIDQTTGGFFISGKSPDRMYYYQDFLPGIGWRVIVGQPYAVVMHDVIIIRRLLLVTFLTGLVVTIIISELLAARMSQKIVKMTELADLVRKGNLDIKLDIEGDDEIASLARSFNSMLARLNHLILREYNENLLRKEAELNLLQAQINPHFLYNTLGSIKSMTVDEGAGSASRMLQRLASYLRYNLGPSGENSLVTVGDELRNLKDYLAIQQCRFDDKIEISFDVSPDVVHGKILKMSLQPIVENSFIHGFEPKTGKSRLQIVGTTSHECITVSVIDDGVGMSEEKEDEIGRFLKNTPYVLDEHHLPMVGIFNVNARLKYRFGDSYGLTIHRNGLGGVTSKLMLPPVEKRQAQQ